MVDLSIVLSALAHWGWDTRRTASVRRLMSHGSPWSARFIRAPRAINPGLGGWDKISFPQLSLRINLQHHSSITLCPHKSTWQKRNVKLHERLACVHKEAQSKSEMRVCVQHSHVKLYENILLKAFLHLGEECQKFYEFWNRLPMEGCPTFHKQISRAHDRVLMKFVGVSKRCWNNKEK